MGFGPFIPMRDNRSLKQKLLNVILFVVLIGSLPFAVGAKCRDDVVEIKGDWGQARFRVEIADTPQLQQRGLMERDALGISQGMLFVFKEPRPVSFWMKDTLIPLDMLFTDQRGMITKINHQAEPLTTRTFFGGDDVAYVLEINGGLAEKFGISEGDFIRHPRIEADLAVWPCNDQL